GPSGAGAWPHRNTAGSGRRGPGAGSIAVAGLELEIGSAERAWQILDVDHQAVYAAAIAGIVREGGSAPRQQRGFVWRNGRIVRGAGGRILAVEHRVVVKDAPANDARGDGRLDRRAHRNMPIHDVG